MAYFAERLNAAQEFATIRGTDIATAGTVADVANSSTSYLRFTAATQLTSLVAGPSGKQLVITNTNASPLLVKNLTGTAGNQIFTGTGADISLISGASLSLIYDDASTLWRNAAFYTTGSTPVSPLQGSNTITAIPAGFIGQQIISSVPVGTVYGGGSGLGADATSITLTNGLWDVQYMLGMDYTTSAATNFRLLTWIGTTVGNNLTEATIRNALVDNIAAAVPNIWTNVSQQVRVSYDGTNILYPDGQTGIGNVLRLKFLVATIVTAPTYYGVLRAVRAQ
jgi:hypothetical protein